MSSKAERFRAKQAAAGLVQANEWVPSNQRELFRAVAKALRNGEPVHIGAVPSNQPKPEPKPIPKTTEGLAAAKAAKAAKQKAQRAAKQKEWAAIYNAPNAQHRTVYTPSREQRDGVVASERVIHNGQGFPSGTETVVILKGKTAYTKRSIRMMDSNPEGRGDWAIGMTAAQKKQAITALRRELKAHHPDTGSDPDPIAFKKVKDALDILRRQNKETR